MGLNRWPKTWAFVAGVTMAWTLGGLMTLAGAQSLREGSLREGIEGPIPIYIVSDRMEADNKNQWVYFIGNVTATRGAMTLHSDRLEIYRNEEKDQIDRIEAIGHVDINHQGKFATGEKAIFHEADQSLVLTGNPKAWEDSNIITGEKMIFYLDSDRVVVEGNESKRVDVVLYPDGEDNRYIRTSPARRETPSPEENGVGGVEDDGTSELPAGGPGAGEVLSTP